MEAGQHRRTGASSCIGGASRWAAVAVIAMQLLAACSSVPLRLPWSSPSPSPSPSNRSVRWDNFNRPDGRLDLSEGGRLPSGQVWHLAFAANAGSTGTAADLKIVDRKLRFDGPGASYLWTTGATPSAASVDFMFEAGTTGFASVGLIFSKKEGLSPLGVDGVAVNSVHCGFGPDSWSCGIFNGASVSIMDRGMYGTPLSEGGVTRYRGSVRRVGADRIQVVTPDGHTHLIRDGRIDQWWGGSVLTEQYQPPATYDTDARPIILGYYVSGPD